MQPKHHPMTRWFQKNIFCDIDESDNWDIILHFVQSSLQIKTEKHRDAYTTWEWKISTAEIILSLSWGLQRVLDDSHDDTRSWIVELM